MFPKLSLFWHFRHHVLVLKTKERFFSLHNKSQSLWMIIWKISCMKSSIWDSAILRTLFRIYLVIAHEYGHSNLFCVMSRLAVPFFYSTIPNCRLTFPNTTTYCWGNGSFVLGIKEEKKSRIAVTEINQPFVFRSFVYFCWKYIVVGSQIFGFLTSFLKRFIFCTLRRFCNIDFVTRQSLIRPQEKYLRPIPNSPHVGFI